MTQVFGTLSKLTNITNCYFWMRNKMLQISLSANIKNAKEEGRFNGTLYFLFMSRLNFDS
jgi:hypothetical protein